MKKILLFLMVSLSLFGDWGSDDSNHLNSIFRNILDFYEGTVDDNKFVPGWKSVAAPSVLKLYEISGADEYGYSNVDLEGNIHELRVINAYSNKNKTMFNQNANMQENKDFYYDEIVRYFADSNFHHDSSIPDYFISLPELGDMNNKMVDRLDNNISDLQQSNETESFRSKFASIRSGFEGMFNDDYRASYITWDLSSLGQIFVDRGIMTVNPLLDFHGVFRIKPELGDFHYEIWYRYFRAESTFGNIIRQVAGFICYLFVLVYVMNDLLNIVDA